ncbi:TPA: pyrimidine dimer DNA glycosylase/endonuclease V [Escherichia coli]|nr:pyrimidine dimer DNA glycosylase/endonuclease V [Escherichia coli]
MTRINLVPVSELSDQHLIAEYRELPRIFNLVLNAQYKGKYPLDFKISDTYLLGTGHVTFFYDKLIFLQRRLKEITEECIKRKFNIANKNDYSLALFNKEWLNDYIPTLKEIEISRKRIQEKLNSHPKFYKYYGKNI